MFKAFALPLFLLTLQGCSDYLLKNDRKTENSAYSADETYCLNQSARKKQVRVPTGSSMTTVDVPAGNDAAAFNACMQKAGHSTRETSSESFLNVSRACRKESQGSPNADDAYAQCIKRSKINVESVPKVKK